MAWWTDEMTTAVSGMAGGAALILGLLAVNLIALAASHPEEPKVGRVFAVHLIALPIFATIGGLTAYYFAGKTGDFLQGLTALALLTVMASGLIPALVEGTAHADTRGNRER